MLHNASRHRQFRHLSGRAVAFGMSHPLGVGNSHFRIGTTEDRWVDTVPFGCYRREVFDRIGLFDEELVRNQDDELNLRLIRRGERITMLSPRIVDASTLPAIRWPSWRGCTINTATTSRSLCLEQGGWRDDLRQLKLPPLFSCWALLIGGMAASARSLAWDCRCLRNSVHR